MVSGKPLKPVKYHDEDLKEMVERAVNGGMEKALGVAEGVVGSDYDALEAGIRATGYKAKRKLKAPNTDEIKENLLKRISGVQEKYEDKIFRAARAAVCGEQRVAAKNIETAVVGFVALLENVRDSVLKEAAGPFLDSTEQFIDSTGTVDFDKEEMSAVKAIDDDGDSTTVPDFTEEIKQAVKIMRGKFEGCHHKVMKVGSYVDVNKGVAGLIEMLKGKLENVRVAAS